MVSSRKVEHVSTKGTDKDAFSINGYVLSAFSVSLKQSAIGSVEFYFKKCGALWVMLYYLEPL